MVAADGEELLRQAYDEPTLALFEEIGGPDFRARYGASKKHDLAASAERLFAGDTIVEAHIKARSLAWVPDAVRFGTSPRDPSVSDHLGHEPDPGNPQPPANDASESADDQAA